MRPKTEQQVLLTLTTQCSQSEHCSQEMRERMDKWEVAKDEQERILDYLRKEKYIDDERFCRFFVHDKMLYNKWGQRKIEQALFLKKIGRDISTPIFEEIPDEDWIEVLKPMIEQKLKTTKGKNDYERSMKTIRWALGRGFLMEHIRNCIHSIEIEGGDEDL